MEPGVFITFEGFEGSGKSTQISRLAERLTAQHVEVLLSREPGGTPLADVIRQALVSRGEIELDPRTELILFLAARSHHVESVIKPALAQGKVVLCDRFSDSTVAYQGAGRGINRETIHLLNNYATDGLVPDLTILVDVEVELGLGRLSRANRDLDRFETENLAFHRRVRDCYRELAKTQPNRFVVVSGDRPVSEVSDEIYSVLRTKYPTWTKGA